MNVIIHGFERPTLWERSRWYRSTEEQEIESVDEVSQGRGRTLLTIAAQSCQLCTFPNATAALCCATRRWLRSA